MSPMHVTLKAGVIDAINYQSMTKNFCGQGLVSLIIGMTNQLITYRLPIRVQFVNHGYDYGLNWTTACPITD